MSITDWFFAEGEIGGIGGGVGVRGFSGRGLFEVD